VYLVDEDGRKHLAATGEDLGDAHYHYRSTKPFCKYGAIDCHNRKELTQWCVKASSGRSFCQQLVSHVAAAVHGAATMDLHTSAAAVQPQTP
jgi:hypothetical protein